MNLRGWREALKADAEVSAENRQEYFRVVEKYLLAAEQQGVEPEPADPFPAMLAELGGEG